MGLDGPVALAFCAHLTDAVAFVSADQPVLPWLLAHSGSEFNFRGHHDAMVLYPGVAGDRIRLRLGFGLNWRLIKDDVF